MESQVGPTIALIFTGLLLVGGIISIVSGLFGPKGAAQQVGAPALASAASGSAAHAPEPAGKERLIFGALAVFLAVVVGGLTLGVPIPGRGEARAEVPLTKIEPKPTVDASSLAGADLGKTIFTRAACNTCHSLKEGERLVGPTMYGIWQTAATREAGKSARDYIRESIENPGAFVPEGYPAGVMPQNFKQQLKPEEIDAILAYLERDFNQK